MKQIFFDANFSSHFAIAFSAFEAAHGKIQVFSTTTEYGEDAPDDQIINDIAQRNAYLISCDSDFKKVKGLTHIIKENNLGWFFYKGVHNPHWVRVKHISSIWEQLRKKVLNNNVQRPFCYHIHSNGNFKNENMLI